MANDSISSIQTGGMKDPVAQSIRNQQMADAAPSKEEVEAQRSQHRIAHAEYKAATGFLSHFDVRKTKFTLKVVAELLGFDSLSRKMKSSQKLKDLTSRFVEPHEIPDDPHPQARIPKPVEVDDDLRVLKQERFLIVRETIEQIEDLRHESVSIASIGCNKAEVVVVDQDSQFDVSPGSQSGIHQSVFTNDTFQKVMDEDSWRDRDSQEKIEKYQQKAGEVYQDAIGWA
jgi:hypothetical protein